MPSQHDHGPGASPPQHLIQPQPHPPHHHLAPRPLAPAALGLGLGGCAMTRRVAATSATARCLTRCLRGITLATAALGCGCCGGGLTRALRHRLAARQL